MRTQNTRGFAIVIVLLVSSVILISVVVTASLTALGSRVSAADERTSYQALLAAESGIDTLAARAEIEGYRGRLDETTFNTWLDSSGVGRVSFDNGNRAQVTVDNVSPPYAPALSVYQVTFRSASNVAGDRGRRVVLQDYTLSQPPRPNIGVPATLTSWPEVDVNGAAKINGYNGNPATAGPDVGFATDISTVNINQLTLKVPPSDPTFPLTVTSETVYDFSVGGYVRIDGNTYRVESIDDVETVTLTAVPSPLTTTLDIDNGATVDAVIIGAARGVDGNTVYPTDTRSFLVGDTIYVDGYEAEIDSINSDGSITVNWQNPSPSFDEGAVITKDYYGATSNAGIKSQSAASEINNDTEPNSTRMNDPFASTGPTLFEQTFGMTYSDFVATYPPQEGGSVPNILSGVTHYKGDLSFQGNNSDICGSGVLVVDGNLSINGSCDASGRGFEGVIYVRGEYSQQGNSSITGAIVAEGPSTFKGNNNTTSVKGTGAGGNASGEPKIEFDPAVIYEQSRVLSPWVFDTIAGTWRQR